MRAIRDLIPLRPASRDSRLSHCRLAILRLGNRAPQPVGIFQLFRRQVTGVAHSLCRQMLRMSDSTRAKAVCDQNPTHQHADSSKNTRFVSSFAAQRLSFSDRSDSVDAYTPWAVTTHWGTSAGSSMRMGESPVAIVLIDTAFPERFTENRKRCHRQLTGWDRGGARNGGFGQISSGPLRDPVATRYTTRPSLRPIPRPSAQPSRPAREAHPSCRCGRHAANA